MNDKNFTYEWVCQFIANRISNLRETKGVSAQKMSLDIGQNKAYINKIENGLAMPSIEGLYNICEYLGITFEDFFDLDIKSPDKMKELVEGAKKLQDDSLQTVIDIIKKLN